jgi:hypothetical protein
MSFAITKPAANTNINLKDQIMYTSRHQILISIMTMKRFDFSTVTKIAVFCDVALCVWVGSSGIWNDQSVFILKVKLSWTVCPEAEGTTIL